MDSCHPSGPLRLPQELYRIVTPLLWQEWDKSLRQHPDQQFRSYIVDGIRGGFRLGFDRGTPLQAPPRLNMLSAEEHPMVISEYLAAEC